MSVGWVSEEELPLSSHSHLDVLLPINVLLTPVHHTNVTWDRERGQLILDTSGCKDRHNVVLWREKNKEKFVRVIILLFCVGEILFLVCLPVWVYHTG